MILDHSTDVPQGHSQIPHQHRRLIGPPLGPPGRVLEPEWQSRL